MYIYSYLHIYVIDTNIISRWLVSVFFCALEEFGGSDYPNLMGMFLHSWVVKTTN